MPSKKSSKSSSKSVPSQNFNQETDLCYEKPFYVWYAFSWIFAYKIGAKEKN